MDKVLKISFILIGLLLIPLFWYLLSPLFIDDIVNEDLPIINNLENPETNKQEVLMMASFKDADNFHKTSGNAIILEDDSQKFLRLEDFESTNGPDLYVYLATDTKATRFVDLGKLKGNKGNQNYEIPTGTDLDKNSEVLIWCKQFGVLFGSAKL